MAFIQCKATSRQSGERCKRSVTPGKEVCVIHGSRGGRPPSTYRYAKVVEKCPELKANYDELQEEVEVAGKVDLSVREEITLLRARIMTALECYEPDSDRPPIDPKIIQDMWRDLTRTAQKEREIEISLEGLVALGKVREMFKVIASTFSRHIPASGQEECWADLKQAMEPYRAMLENGGAGDLVALPEATDE